MKAKEYLLVVEDSPTQALGIKSLLQASGFQVEIARDGLEGLSMVRQKPPDAVVTDLEMPNMNGLELVEAVKREFPEMPIVLTTARGSEGIAQEALERGAASFVPKSHMQLDMVETLRRLLAIVHQKRVEKLVTDLVTGTQVEFLLTNDDSLVPHIISRIQDEMASMSICDEGDLVQVATALDEALVNAIIHGNLEVSSELREVDDGKAYTELANERRKLPPYSERRVYVNARTTRSEAVFVIRDEGPGFDPAAIPDPTDPANLDRVSGRGLLLINAFMDEVRHNDLGNEITMIKRKT